MTLDGYRIIREVHASNRSQIYLAIDNGTGRQIALKTPSVNYEDDLGYIDRFVLEEWVGRRIDNPHAADIKNRLENNVARWGPPPAHESRFLAGSGEGGM